MKKNNILILGIIFTILVIVFLFLVKVDNPNLNLVQIKYAELIEKVENEEDFILIVSRSTCSHCEEYKPKVSAIAHDNNIKVYYIDFDLENKKNQEKFLDEFNQTGETPITVFFKGGKETSVLNRIEGTVDSNVITEKFKKMGFIK